MKKLIKENKVGFIIGAVYVLIALFFSYYIYFLSPMSVGSFSDTPKTLMQDLSIIAYPLIFISLPIRFLVEYILRDDLYESSRHITFASITMFSIAFWPTTGVLVEKVIKKILKKR